MPGRSGLLGKIAKVTSGILRKLRIAKKQDARQKPSSVMQARFNPSTMQFENLDQELAEEFADDLKKLIERQAFAWVPLSAGYAKRKQMLGQDPRILIATGTYINAIQAMPDPSGSGWTVGIPPTPLGNGSSYTLKDLARWLEYGTRRMPARPHWRPALVRWQAKSYRAKMTMKHSALVYLRRRGFR